MGYSIALAGNPNCGKTTLFNSLTGSKQYVGNWPGVTVEKKSGDIKGTDDELVDLPGIYSLSPYSLDEVVARDYLLNGHPDTIIDIVDATNIERNLYLTTQLTELGIPVVIALNMMDLFEKSGDKLDIKKLEVLTGCPVVPVSALKNSNVDAISIQKSFWYTPMLAARMALITCVAGKNGLTFKKKSGSSCSGKLRAVPS